jgi:hypothetical protein
MLCTALGKGELHPNQTVHLVKAKDDRPSMRAAWRTDIVFCSIAAPLILQDIQDIMSTSYHQVRLLSIHTIRNFNF